MQTVISIIGLAVGFTCFSLATLWIRYETTYDSFHKDAKNLYVPTMPDPYENGLTFNVPNQALDNVKEIFPEVKELYEVYHGKITATIGERTVKLNELAASQETNETTGNI